MSETKKRKRTCWSIKKTLMTKSRESAIAAIQLFNTPNLYFRSETFIVLIIIAWRLLLYAYYNKLGVEYRHYKELPNGKRKITIGHDNEPTYSSLKECLDFTECPLDSATKNNLLFLIGLRNKLEHYMVPKIENALGARFHACCLDYNEYIKKLFGDKYGIDKELSFAIQLTGIEEAQAKKLESYNLPSSVLKYITDFDSSLSKDEYNDPHYSYRLLFVRKLENSKTRADRVCEFIKLDPEILEALSNEEYERIYVKEKSKEEEKYYVKDIVDNMHELGYSKFNTYHHTKLWQEKDAKNPKYHYGTQIKTFWYWYSSWIDVVRKYCEENKDKFQ